MLRREAIQGSQGDRGKKLRGKGKRVEGPGRRGRGTREGSFRGESLPKGYRGAKRRREDGKREEGEGKQGVVAPR